MRSNRRKTIEALRRLAERPGTPHEGKVARAMLEKMEARTVPVRPFVASEWPRFTPIFYNYWCYTNAAGVIIGKEPKIIQGETWLRIKFEHLKTPRRVPVTSRKGCHLSKVPLSREESEEMWRLWD